MKTGLCLFTDSLEPSGVGEHMMLLAQELRDDYRIAFACPANVPGQQLLRRADALGLATFALEPISPDDAEIDEACAALLAGEYRRLQDWLRARDMTIFHGHAGIGWEGHDAIFAARAAGVPTVIRTEHLPYLITDPKQIREHRQLMPLLDNMICVSQVAADSFVDAGIEDHRICVVRNGIRPGRSCYSKAQARQMLRDELQLPSHAQILLSIGRFTEQKGHAYLLEAMPSLVAQHPDAHSIWVGCGPLEGELRARIDELNLANHVHLLGRRSDVADLLAACDALVLPSLFEGLPLVAIEAMAASIPVIGTDVCGTSEAVVDGETGRLVPPRDSLALSDALCEVLGDEMMAARWGNNGLRYFEAQFQAARMARDTAAIYRGASRTKQTKNHEMLELSAV